MIGNEIVIGAIAVVLLIGITIGIYWLFSKLEEKTPHKYSPYYCPHCALFLADYSVLFGLRADYNYLCPRCGERM